MSSPVTVSFHSFIKIDRRKKDAVYMQIVYQFINAVKSKLLEDDDQLPGSRKIAEDLQVHRKTIVAALTELQEQGWINILPNIGSFVRNPELSPGEAKKSKAFQHPPETANFHFRKDFILDTPLEEHETKLFYTDGTPDYRINKVEELIRFYTSVLRRKKQNGVFSNSMGGNQFFKNQLSYYLNLTRGFHLSRDFLLPVAGLEQVHSILSRLLISKGDVVLVEELSYFLPNMIYSQAGAKMKTIPIDDNGMDINYIQNHFKPGEIRFVYINTKCQYPTTVSLSEERKVQLLDLAETYDFIVIEDDTDFEYSALKNREESLFRIDGGSRVIYIGAFGGFLNPGFQMNFLIAPKDLLQEAEKYLNIFGKPDAMMKKALGEIINQGDIHRYQRKFKKAIAERKEMFARMLSTHFENQIDFTVPSSGLAFWIQFKSFFSLTHLQKRAGEKGLFIPSICLYQNRRIIALRLGFAHQNNQEMEEAVKILAEAYREVVA